MLVVPRIHTELARRAFSVAAPSTWNSLCPTGPADIRLCENILTFKRQNPSVQTHSCAASSASVSAEGAIQIRYYYLTFFNLPCPATATATAATAATTATA